MWSSCVVFLFVLALAQAGLPSSGTMQAMFIEDAQKMASSRIVSGWEAQEGQIPHQTSLRMITAFGNVFSCGGSLIHHNWVITAGHCVANSWSLVNFVVRFGLINQTRPAMIQETTRRHFHYNFLEYYPFVQMYDIALLGLDEAVPYGELIQPIRLQSRTQRDQDYSGVTMVTSGFGLTQTGGQPSEVLYWVYQRGINNILCRDFYIFVEESIVCSMYYNVTSQSACDGDSGGPLTVVDKDGQLTMVGIASFVSSSGCATATPTGYTRPGYYHDWITNITGIDFDWEFDPSDNGSTINAVMNNSVVFVFLMFFYMSLNLYE